MTCSHLTTLKILYMLFFFSSRRRHTRCGRDWSSDVCSSDLAKFKPNTFSSTVQADITDINASYHALQTSIEKRMSHGFSVLANYTYSKSLDDLPFGEGVSGFDTGYSTLPFNDPDRHRIDHGPSRFDH